MSPDVGTRESLDAWKRSPGKAAEEAMWEEPKENDWVQDDQRGAALRKAAKAASIAGMLVAAGFWSGLAPYDGVVRFIVAAGALAAAFLAIRAMQYAIASVFGALALLYSPVAPAFSLSADWRRTTAVAIAVLFVASLADLRSRKAQSD